MKEKGQSGRGCFLVFKNFRAFWFPGSPAGRDFGVQPFYATDGDQNGNGICPRSWQVDGKPRTGTQGQCLTLSPLPSDAMPTWEPFKVMAHLLQWLLWVLGERTNSWTELTRAIMLCPLLKSQPWFFCFVLFSPLTLNSVPVRFVLPDSSVSS